VVPLSQSFSTLLLSKEYALYDSVNGEVLVREVAEQSAVRIADRIVAASEIEQSELVRLYGADPSKIRVVPLGVDTRMFRPLRQTDARAAVGRDACALLIVFVGWFASILGNNYLLVAL